MSSALKTGITGTYPNLELDYVNLIVSKGALPGARNAAAAFVEGNKLQFSWDYDELAEFELRRDQVMLLAYSPSSKSSFYTIGGPQRSIGEAILNVYPEVEHESFETYIAFIREDRKSLSMSNYTGRILLP